MHVHFQILWVINQAVTSQYVNILIYQVWTRRPVTTERTRVGKQGVWFVACPAALPHWRQLAESAYGGCGRTGLLWVASGGWWLGLLFYFPSVVSDGSREVDPFRVRGQRPDHGYCFPWIVWSWFLLRCRFWCDGWGGGCWAMVFSGRLFRCCFLTGRWWEPGSVETGGGG